MTAGKYFSKIVFQCKCVLLLLFIFNSFTKNAWAGKWTLWHCYISRKFWLYVRTIGVCGYGYVHEYIHGKSVDMDIDMDGKFYIHGKPVLICSESTSVCVAVSAIVFQLSKP